MENLNKYAEFGKKDCQANCDRKSIMTKDGPVIICDFCLRVVRDLRTGL